MYSFLFLWSVYRVYNYVIVLNSYFFWSICRGGGKESLLGYFRVLIINFLKLFCVIVIFFERKKWKRKYCVVVDNYFFCIILKLFL